jgi:hypothetical protein
MKVDKELIEKYHRQECTPDEMLAVEQWLLSDTSDEELPGDLHLLEQEMWQGIMPPPPKKKYAFLPIAAAAAVLLAVVFTGLRFFHHLDVERPVAVNNQTIHLKYISATDYNLSVAPNSTAMLNRELGTMKFTGSLMLKPKEDMELSLDNGRQKLEFKAGQTYILVNGDGEVVVVNERNLMDMPSVLQQRISAEFKI